MLDALASRLAKYALSHKREQADGLASMESERQAATEDALKVLYFILHHNLPLDLFPDLVELLVDLGTSRLRSLHAGKNATHTSRKPAQEAETCAHLLPLCQCLYHGLALAYNNLFAGMSALAKLDQMLDSLHCKYYK